MQKTLSRKVEIEGVGLHSGLPSRLVINPAPENSGIVFVRSDLEEKIYFRHYIRRWLIRVTAPVWVMKISKLSAPLNILWQRFMS